MDVMVKRFVRANRIPAVLPPAIPPATHPGWRESDPALNAFLESVNQHRPDRRGFGPFWALTARAMIVLSFVLLALSTKAGVRAVGVIGLTVNDLGSELSFFTNTLPFELVSISKAGGKEQDALLGLKNVKLLVAELKLGDEHITLTEHLDSKLRSLVSAHRHCRERHGQGLRAITRTSREICFHRAADIAGVEQGRSGHQGVLFP